MSPRPVPVRLVPIVAPDYGELREMADRIWQVAYPGIISPEQIDYMLERMYAPGAISEDATRRGVVYRWIEVNGARTGFLANDPIRPGSPCFLHKFYVEAARQRGGIGTTVLRQFAEEVAGGGASGIELRVNRHNERAIAFYRKNGFTVVCEDCADIGGGFVMDDFVLWRPV